MRFLSLSMYFAGARLSFRLEYKERHCFGWFRDNFRSYFVLAWLLNFLDFDGTCFQDWHVVGSHFTFWNLDLEYIYFSCRSFFSDPLCDLAYGTSLAFDYDDTWLCTLAKLCNQVPARFQDCSRFSGRVVPYDQLVLPEIGAQQLRCCEWTS